MRTAIALGSNVGDRFEAITRARDAVLAIPGISGPLLCSSLYETEPVDAPAGSEAFLNAVMEVEFTGSLDSLLSALQSIESEMGRPSQRAVNAPRVIDLDILYAANALRASPRLVLPHPRLHQRRFVLAPLAEILPNLRLPGFENTISDLLNTLRDEAAVERAKQQWKTLCATS